MHPALLCVLVALLAASTGNADEAASDQLSIPLYWWDQTFPSHHTTGSMFTAVAVDSSRKNRTEIYVGQRSATYSQPIIVYDYEGNVLRSWGKHDIPLIGGAFGVNGIALQYTDNDTYVIVADKLEHTVKKFTRDGVLVARVGTPGQAGNGIDPIQFDQVSGIAVGPEAIYVSDGEGGMNNRVVVFDLDLSPEPLLVYGEPGSHEGQFNSPQRYECHTMHQVSGDCLNL
jgi:hypothetical protein